MLDIILNIENGDILALIRDNKFEEALMIMNNRFTNDQEFDQLNHLYLLQGYCYYKMQQYPLAISVLNKILKYRYSSAMEHHLLSQAFYLLAETHLKHSKGRNIAKNRSTFIAISSCMNLLCYREEVLTLMDRFLKTIGEVNMKK